MDLDHLHSAVFEEADHPAAPSASENLSTSVLSQTLSFLDTRFSILRQREEGRGTTFTSARWRSAVHQASTRSGRRMTARTAPERSYRVLGWMLYAPCAAVPRTTVATLRRATGPVLSLKKERAGTSTKGRHRGSRGARTLGQRYGTVSFTKRPNRALVRGYRIQISPRRPDGRAFFRVDVVRAHEKLAPGTRVMPFRRVFVLRVNSHYPVLR